MKRPRLASGTWKPESVFVDIYRVGFVFAAVGGGVIAVFCYGSYADDLEGLSLLAVTGALSGFAYWLLVMNDYLGLKR